MTDVSAQFLDVGVPPAHRRVAYLRQSGAAEGEAGLVWLCGLKSEMTSAKATAVATWAEERRKSCLRFDYSGHGQSEGAFEAGTVSRWLEETRSVFARLTDGPQVLVGSSMGGYLALLLLRALIAEQPEQAARIRALVLIAPAWDMTDLMWRNFSSSARRDIEEKGVFLRGARKLRSYRDLGSIKEIDSK
jgi:pimeloyl-ACP methyl ester carboxylesterase